MSDEYALMNFFFKVEHGNQYLTASRCDKFDIAVNGHEASLYFDIQALLAWENRVFSGKDIDKPFTFTYDTSVWSKASESNMASMTVNKELELPKLTDTSSHEDYATAKPYVAMCMKWLQNHDPATKNKAELQQRKKIYQFILLWCVGTDECSMELEKSFIEYKTADLMMYYLGGWATHFIEANDADDLNGRLAGIEAIIECYNNYPKALKKDKKKILAFKKMQEDGTLRQYVIDNIGK